MSSGLKRTQSKSEHHTALLAKKLAEKVELDAQMEKILDEAVDAQLNRDEKLEAKLKKQETKLAAKIEKLDHKIEQLRCKIDAEVDEEAEKPEQKLTGKLKLSKLIPMKSVPTSPVNSVPPTPRDSEDIRVLFTVFDLEGVELEMKAKLSAPASRIAKAYAKSTHKENFNDVILRTSDGTRLALDAPLSNSKLLEGSRISATMNVPKVSSVTFRVRGKDVLPLDMTAKTTTKIAKVVSAWRSHLKADADTKLTVVGEQVGLPHYHERFTLGECHVVDGSVLRVLVDDQADEEFDDKVDESKEKKTKAKATSDANDDTAIDKVVDETREETEENAETDEDRAKSDTEQVVENDDKTDEPKKDKKKDKKRVKKAEETEDNEVKAATDEEEAATPSTDNVEETKSSPATSDTASPKSADEHVRIVPMTPERKSSLPVEDIDAGDAWRAKWSFEGASQRELSLAKNELVLVIRRKKEWWKGVRASDGKQGWFPRTRLVAAKPAEIESLKIALSGLSRSASAIKRNELRASRHVSKAEVASMFFGEDEVVHTEALDEVAELEKQAAEFGDAADECCTLIKQRKHGRLAFDIEHIPTPLGAAVRVDNIGVLLLKEHEAQVHVTGEHTLKVEVVLNTILTQNDYPFVAEFDADIDGLVLTSNNASVQDDGEVLSTPLRLPLSKACVITKDGVAKPLNLTRVLRRGNSRTVPSRVISDTIRRNATKLAASADMSSPRDSPRRPSGAQLYGTDVNEASMELDESSSSTLRSSDYDDDDDDDDDDAPPPVPDDGPVAPPPVPAALAVTPAKPGYNDKIVNMKLTDADIKKYGKKSLNKIGNSKAQLHYWLAQNLLTVLIKDVRKQQDRNIIYAADNDEAAIDVLHRKLQTIVNSKAVPKIQLAQDRTAVGAMLSQIFPVRDAWLAVRPDQDRACAQWLQRVGQRFMLLEGRLSAQEVLDLDYEVRYPPRDDDDDGAGAADVSSDEAASSSDSLDDTALMPGQSDALNAIAAGAERGNKLSVSKRLKSKLKAKAAKPNTAAPLSPAKSPPRVKKPASKSRRTSAVDAVTEAVVEAPPQIAAPQVQSFPAVVRAKFEYGGGAAGELHLPDNAIATALRQINKDWVLCERKGEQGRVPVSYIEYLSEEEIKNVKDVKDILPESKENKEANDSTNNNDMRRPSIAALVAEAAQDSDDSEEVETAVENTSGDADEPMTSVDSPSEHEQNEPNVQTSSVDEHRTNGNASHDDGKQEPDGANDDTTGATKPESKVLTMIAGATAMDSPATPEPSLNTSTHVLKAEVHVLEDKKPNNWFDLFIEAGLSENIAQKYKSEFEENEIEFQQLFDVEKTELQMVGVKVGHILKITKTIEKLKANGFKPS